MLANGELRWWSLIAKPLGDSHGAHAGWRGVATDVISIQNKNADLRFLAERDSLTGLTNRGEFPERLYALTTANGATEPLALVCLNVDHFKRISDAHAHLFCDALLRVIDKRLLSLTRKGDVVVRANAAQRQLPAAAGRSGARRTVQRGTATADGSR